MLPRGSSWSPWGPWNPWNRWSPWNLLTPTPFRDKTSGIPAGNVRNSYGKVTSSRKTSGQILAQTMTRPRPTVNVGRPPVNHVCCSLQIITSRTAAFQTSVSRTTATPHLPDCCLPHHRLPDCCLQPNMSRRVTCAVGWEGNDLGPRRNVLGPSRQCSGAEKACAGATRKCSVTSPHASMFPNSRVPA